MQGVWSLGWEDPLEKGMATHSSILVCLFVSSMYIYWFIHRHYPGGGEGEGGINAESSMETHTRPQLTQIASRIC